MLLAHYLIFSLYLLSPRGLSLKTGFLVASFIKFQFDLILDNILLKKYEGQGPDSCWVAFLEDWQQFKMLTKLSMENEKMGLDAYF